MGRDTITRIEKSDYLVKGAIVYQLSVISALWLGSLKLLNLAFSIKYIVVDVVLMLIFTAIDAVDDVVLSLLLLLLL